MAGVVRSHIEKGGDQLARDREIHETEQFKGLEDLGDAAAGELSLEWIHGNLQLASPILVASVLGG